MANKYRGEIAATLDGAPVTLCLTLGALAELETAFGSDDMLALASRFTAGRISANDCVRIIGAGLRGGGHDIPDVHVARMRGDDGAAGYIDIVARLLAATFGGPIGGAIAGAVTSATNETSTAMAKAEVAYETRGPVVPLTSTAHEPPRPFPGPR
jgi:hypothetical protein